MFPSLVNCCTIDWFSSWPAEALLNVARGSMQDPDADMRLGDDEEACIETFKFMQQTVETASQDFQDKMRRITYVTPTSYLELLSTFKKILKSQRTKVEKGISRLAKGLDVLKTAAVEVDKLQRKLEADAPMLAKTQIEVEETKKIIAEKTINAEAVKAVVVVEEEEASKQAAEVKKIKDNADAELSSALPELDAAVKKVQGIPVSAFYSIRTMLRPPASAVAVFKICCFFLLPNDKPKAPKDDKKEIDPEGYWQLSLTKFLSNPNQFLKDLLSYDRDNIPDSLVAKVKPQMELEEMQESRIEKASKDLLPVRVWVVAMLKYHQVLKIVNPMRETARVMGEKLDVVMTALREKQAKVKAINEELDELNANDARKTAEAKKLTEDIDECNKRLVRAEKMIGGLEGERTRWTETVANLSIQKDMLIGDCLIASGMISYAGPFTADFRE